MSDLLSLSAVQLERIVSSIGHKCTHALCNQNGDSAMLAASVENGKEIELAFFFRSDGSLH